MFLIFGTHGTPMEPLLKQKRVPHFSYAFFIVSLDRKKEILIYIENGTPGTHQNNRSCVLIFPLKIYSIFISCIYTSYLFLGFQGFHVHQLIYR